ncbi:hypothetical protein P171DRAFT_521927 [Karstenula rhodostoma CBS 690.94]|uniref:Uncharacterized protein n=1 Tax=Karstenula rhodostoma CBS 690.94 TaxID=1392251 RepID=A0A9P4PG82_9PLEO|nr:hypothetical protein P171DRAFT_521927 [Karstenula rhodostoma CBS 690.94]
MASGPLIQLPLPTMLGFVEAANWDTITATHLALQVSRNLHQHFQDDAKIVSFTSWNVTTNGTSNVMTLALGDTALPNFHSDFPVQPSNSGISVRDRKGTHSYGRNEESVGAEFCERSGWNSCSGETTKKH